MPPTGRSVASIPPYQFDRHMERGDNLSGVWKGEDRVVRVGVFLTRVAAGPCKPTLVGLGWAPRCAGRHSIPPPERAHMKNDGSPIEEELTCTAGSIAHDHVFECIVSSVTL